MTVTLILDRVIQHTIVHHSLTSTYVSNFVQIGKTFFMDGQTDIETNFDGYGSTLSGPKNAQKKIKRRVKLQNKCHSAAT